MGIDSDPASYCRELAYAAPPGYYLRIARHTPGIDIYGLSQPNRRTYASKG